MDGLENFFNALSEHLADKGVNLEELKPGNPDECPSNVYEWGLCDDCEYYEECAEKTDVSRYFKE